MGIVALLVIAGVIGYQVRRAFAEGPPTTDPLYFSGTLTEGGAAVNGARDVTVRLFAEETGAPALCETAAPGATLTAGRFRIPLDASCVDAIRAYGDLWMVVEVGGVPLGRRTKLGVSFPQACVTAVAAPG